MPLTEREKVAHLLRRFGLGASVAELDFYSQRGYQGAVDLMLDFDRDEGFDFEPKEFGKTNAVANIKAAQFWWGARLIMTRIPLKEKLTLFWHDHFATSAQKVDSPGVMLVQNQILRDNCIGSFRDLLTNVSKDPAMIFWLDNQLNTRGKPNENFAREVMELFTLGIGNYTEKDIQEAARAFTGWGFAVAGNRRAQSLPRRPARFIFDMDEHDGGAKTVFGQTGHFTGDDILRILCDLPRTSVYITTKMWEWFVYPEPSTALVDRLAKTFRDSDLDIKTLVRAIMTSDEFFSEKAVSHQYKSPVDFCIPTLRQLGLGSLMRDRLNQQRESGEFAPLSVAPAALGVNAMKSMGMELMYPPDVAGWDGGSSWISSATMVERIKWADKLFPPPTGAAGGQSLRLPAANYVGDDRSPAQFAAALIKVFDANLPASKVEQVKVAVENEIGQALNAQSAQKAANLTCRLVFGAPEFQFC